MKTVIVDANNPTDACRKCQKWHGWTPDAVREVESGVHYMRSYMCFESATDAETWDKQK